MNPTYDFTGQVALVVGASSGMGLATARAFAEVGRSGVDGGYTARWSLEPRHTHQRQPLGPAWRSTTPNEGRISKTGRP